MRFASALIGVMLLLPPTTTLAANEDGSAVAVLDGGRTLAPIRAVTEWLGAGVSWDAENDTVEIGRANTMVKLRPDSETAQVNGEEVELDTPPKVLAGVTYVPVRFVTEAFGATPDFDDGLLTLYPPTGGQQMQLRVALLKDDWLTYRGPWFDIDYPASFRPLGFDRASESNGYDEDGMRFGSSDGKVEFYVYSPQWSGDPQWPKVAPGEMLFDRNSTTEGHGPERKKLTWVTVTGPTDDYTRSWIEVHQPELNVKYYLGIRYDTLATYERWRDDYRRFRNSLVQYAD